VRTACGSFPSGGALKRWYKRVCPKEIEVKNVIHKVGQSKEVGEETGESIKRK
jgi:hypothetical protein